MNEFTAFLHRLCDSAGKHTLASFRVNSTVDNKLDQGFDPVTKGDRDAEEAIRTLINATYPDHGILGEEFGAEKLDAEYVWIIDPIDGTRAFISGIPVWGTLIGLARHGKMVAGIMHQPFTGERYYSDGQKSWYLGPDVTAARKIITRQTGDLAGALLMTTSPKIFSSQHSAAFLRVEQAVRMARYGCDCYAYCMVAAGHVDLVVESDLNAHDIAALIPVIQMAGGIITDWQGNPVDVLNIGDGQVVAAGNARVHGEALELLNS